MCIEILLGGKIIKPKETFKANGGLLIQDEKLSLMATVILKEVHWTGWVREEELSKWTDRAWTRAEIFATKFNQRGRWYDVPPDQIIKGIAFNTGEKIILKVVTREAIGKEVNVQERFASTGRRLLILRS